MRAEQEKEINRITEMVFSSLDFLIFYPVFVHDCYLYDISFAILLEMDD